MHFELLSLSVYYTVYSHSPYLHYNNLSEYKTLHELETEVELQLSVYVTAV